jgi:hypothetical protein
MTLTELKQEISFLKDKVLTHKAKHALGFARMKLESNLLDKLERENDIFPVVINSIKLAMICEVDFYNEFESNKELRKILLKLNSLLKEIKNFFSQEYGYEE